MVCRLICVLVYVALSLSTNRDTQPESVRLSIARYYLYVYICGGVVEAFNSFNVALVPFYFPREVQAWDGKTTVRKKSGEEKVKGKAMKTRRVVFKK